MNHESLSPEHLSTPRRILEIGVGPEPFRGTGYAARHSLEDAYYIGIDDFASNKFDLELYRDLPDRERNQQEEVRRYKKTTFDEARSEADKRKNTDIDYVYASGAKLPFPDEIFDEVLLANVIGDPRVSPVGGHILLREAARVLTPKGRIVLKEEYTPDYAHQALRSDDIPAMGLEMSIYYPGEPGWNEIAEPFNPMVHEQDKPENRTMIVELRKIAQLNS